MTVQPFELLPFACNTLQRFARFTPPLGITGTVERVNQQLMLQYVLTGDLSVLTIPSTSPRPARQDHLWQTTCFEFFLAVPSSESYWEFNLSPSRDWNVYRFSGYRSGMVRESNIQTLPFNLNRTDTALTLDVCFALEQLTPVVVESESLLMGISAVVASDLGESSYWALAHPGKQADFHARNSFVIQVHRERGIGMG